MYCGSRRTGMSIMVAPLDGKARSLTCRGSLGGVPGGFWQAAWKRWCHRHALEQPYRHSIMTRQGSRFFAWRSNAARERVQIIRERLGMKQILIVSTSPRKGGNSTNSPGAHVKRATRSKRFACVTRRSSFAKAALPARRPGAASLTMTCRALLRP